MEDSKASAKVAPEFEAGNDHYGNHNNNLKTSTSSLSLQPNSSNNENQHFQVEEDDGGGKMPAVVREREEPPIVIHSNFAGANVADAAMPLMNVSHPGNKAAAQPLAQEPFIANENVETRLQAAGARNQAHKKRESAARKQPNTNGYNGHSEPMIGVETLVNNNNNARAEPMDIEQPAEDDRLPHLQQEEDAAMMDDEENRVEGEFLGQQHPHLQARQPRNNVNNNNDDAQQVGEALAAFAARRNSRNHNNNENHHENGARQEQQQQQANNIIAADEDDDGPPPAVARVGGDADGGMMINALLNELGLPPELRVMMDAGVVRAAQQPPDPLEAAAAARPEPAVAPAASAHILRQWLRQCWTQGGNLLEFGSHHPLTSHKIRPPLLEALKRKMIAAQQEQKRRLPLHVVLRNARFADGGAAKMADLIEFLEPSTLEIIDTSTMSTSSSGRAGRNMMLERAIAAAGGTLIMDAPGGFAAPDVVHGFAAADNDQFGGGGVERRRFFVAAAPRNRIGEILRAANRNGGPHQRVVVPAAVRWLQPDVPRPPGAPAAQHAAAAANNDNIDDGDGHDNNNEQGAVRPLVRARHALQRAERVLRNVQAADRPVDRARQAELMQRLEGLRVRAAALRNEMAERAANQDVGMAAAQDEEGGAGGEAAGDNNDDAAPEPRNNNNNNNGVAAAPDPPRPNNIPAAPQNNNRDPDADSPLQQNNPNSANKILTHDIVVALFSGLIYNSRLEKLNLTGLGLRNEGVVRLLCCILKNSRLTLKNLNFSACRWNIRSVSQVAQAWYTSPPVSLTHFALTRSNLVDDSVIRVLFPALCKGAPLLKSLTLCDNPLVTFEGSIGQITSFLSRHTVIEELNITLALEDKHPSTEESSEGDEDGSRIARDDNWSTTTVVDASETHSWALLNFCAAVRKHSSLARLGFETITVKKSGTETPPSSRSKTVLPPPHMAVALLEVAMEKGTLDGLRLIKLLYWQRENSKKGIPKKASLQIFGLYPTLEETNVLLGGIQSFAANTGLGDLELRGCFMPEPASDLAEKEKSKPPPGEEGVLAMPEAYNVRDLQRRRRRSKRSAPDSVVAWARSIQQLQCSDPMSLSMKEIAPPSTNLTGMMLRKLFQEAGLDRFILESSRSFPYEEIFKNTSGKLRCLALDQCRLKNVELVTLFTAGCIGQESKKYMVQECLKILSLPQNMLTGACLPVLIEFLEHNPQLEKLILRSNSTLLKPSLATEASAATQDNNRRHFADAVASHQSLRWLCLQDTGLDMDPVSVALMQSFDVNPIRKFLQFDFARLTRADKESNNIEGSRTNIYFGSHGSAADERSVVDCFSCMRNLGSILLHDGHGRFRLPLQPLVKAVLARVCQLEELTINFHLERNPQPNHPTITALANALQNHESLRTLRLAGPALTDAGLSTLMDEAFGSTLKLKKLSLRRTGLTTASIATIQQLLRHQDRIECLEVSQSSLLRGDIVDRIDPLTDAIAGHATLKKLVLRSCYINTTTLVHLLQALERGDNIEHLDIGGNLFLQSPEWPWANHLPRLSKLRYLKVPRSMWIYGNWGDFVLRLNRSASICQVEYDAMPQFDHFPRVPVHALGLGDDSSYNSRKVPDPALENITRRNRFLQKVPEMVGHGGAIDKLVPLILEKLGSNHGEGSATFSFLRGLGSHGVWGDVEKIRKRGVSCSGKEEVGKDNERPTKKQRVFSPKARQA